MKLENVVQSACMHTTLGGLCTPVGPEPPQETPLALATNTFLFSKPTAQYINTNFRLHEIPWVIIIVDYL